MAKSAAFARIKGEVLAIAAAIPRGRITTYKAIGETLEVMPRHVAYILTTLKAEEADGIPWHRVTGDGGKITAPKLFEEQKRLLGMEGISASDSVLPDFDKIFISPKQL